MHHVNERTRKKIIEAAQLLEYPIRPDLLPESAKVRTNTIGVIAPFISRWYFSQVLAGIEQALREVTKLRATVVGVQPGSLPNDGKVIEDARKYE